MLVCVSAHRLPTVIVSYQKTFSYIPADHLQSAMWYFANTSVLRCCYAVGSSAAKSIWRHPITYHQLRNCKFGFTKPSVRHMSCYTFSFGQLSYASRFFGQSTGLLKLCGTCAKHMSSVNLLRPQRCAFAKQLRHASNTKTFPTAVSSSVQQVSKRGIPKVSDVYRLLSLAKPEKWKLLGKNLLSLVLVNNMFCSIVLTNFRIQQSFSAITYLWH